MLSTCNRAELYAACDDVEPARATSSSTSSASSTASNASTLTPARLRAAPTSTSARHLFRVAAGLDSLVVGEPQILGQVKEAHTAAATSQTVGPLLNRLFHSSFGVGKRVRTETGLGSGAVSVELRGRRAGAEDLRRAQGPQRAGRRRRRDGQAHRAAHEVAGRAPGDDRQPHDGARGADGRSDRRRVGGALGRARRGARRGSDIVITATGAAAPILTKARIEAVDAAAAQPAAVHHRHRHAARRRAGGRRDRAGVPLQHRRSAGDGRARTWRAAPARSPAPRRSSPRRSRSSAAGCARAARSRRSSPCASGSRRSGAPSCERLEFKLSALPPEARARVDEITRLIVEKLLLTPTEQLKALGDADTVGAYSEA